MNHTCVASERADCNSSAPAAAESLEDDRACARGQSGVILINHNCVVLFRAARMYTAAIVKIKDVNQKGVNGDEHDVSCVRSMSVVGRDW